MVPRCCLLVFSCVFIAAHCLWLTSIYADQEPVQGVRLRSIQGDPASGIARAVVVDEGALVHTALILPEDRDGRIQDDGDARAQAARVLASMEVALQQVRTRLEALVRLHVYVADASVTPLIETLLAERFAGRPVKPAVTFVETGMARDGVLVAMDAVAATAWTTGATGPRRLEVPGLPRRTARPSHAAVQPPGPFVVVSGRAAKGEFEPAIRDTMAQLRGDLEGVGLTLGDVVQIKSFLGDMRRSGRLEEIVAGEFDGDRVPPQVVTEWRQTDVPAEIELIATTSRPGGGLRLEHIEPISARYSRVVRVNSGRPVFISGLHGRSADPAAQVEEMFADLQEILHAAGSDLRHLVKATYYVADSTADERINTIRPTIYDAQRPPAASKIAVRGTGRSGKGSTLDMIAVTAGP